MQNVASCMRGNALRSCVLFFARAVDDMLRAIQLREVNEETESAADKIRVPDDVKERSQAPFVHRLGQLLEKLGQDSEALKVAATTARAHF